MKMDKLCFKSMVNGMKQYMRPENNLLTKPKKFLDLVVFFHYFILLAFYKLLTRIEVKDNWALDEAGNAIRPNHIPFETTLNDIPSFTVGTRSPVWYNVEEKYEGEPYNQWNMTTVSFLFHILWIPSSLTILAFS